MVLFLGLKKTIEPQHDGVEKQAGLIPERHGTGFAGPPALPPASLS
jgi:hypothetical protein